MRVLQYSKTGVWEADAFCDIGGEMRVNTTDLQSVRQRVHSPLMHMSAEQRASDKPTKTRGQSHIHETPD